ncbi:MAG: XdhC/CoxI family protein [Clostridium sp.]
MDFYSELYNNFNKSNTYTAKIISGKHLGAKLLFQNEELVFNNLEPLDLGCIAAIKEALQHNRGYVISYEDTRIFCEPVTKKPSIIICGAGHISIALIKMCKLLDLDVTVIDDRPSFVNDGRLAGADHSICEPFLSALNKVTSDKSTFFVIVTRGHRYDIDCLREILQKENAYIGMIGSKVRVKRIKDSLLEEGFNEEALNKIYTPIGLKIGAETPEEIAVSIIAEIIAVKNRTLKGSEFPKEILNEIIGESFETNPTALATIISRKGSAPRQVGTKMLICNDGRTIGTIGGGCVEAEVKLLALDVIRTKIPLLKTVDMTGVDAEADGMVCGGVVEVFIEPIY